MKINAANIKRHEMLEGLVTDFLRCNADKSPNNTTIAELLVWSCRSQTDWPEEALSAEAERMRPAKEIRFHDGPEQGCYRKGSNDIVVLEAEVHEQTLEISLQAKDGTRQLLTYRGDFTIFWEDAKT